MNVLCLAPHPDDEAIGCGGVLRAHVMAGDFVRVLFITDGAVGGDAAIRGREAQEAAKIGGWGVRSLLLPDTKLTVRLLAGELDLHPTELQKWDRIYCPNPWDDHIDHKALAAYICGAWPISLASLMGPHEPHPKVWFYEIWTPLTYVARCVEISAHVNIKWGTINCYASQRGNYLADAILALNHYRGLLKGPNNMYAECFG